MYLLRLVIAFPSFESSKANLSRGIQLGGTKVFLRQAAFDKLEKMRNTFLAIQSVKVQSAARRFIFLRQFLRIKNRIILAQAGSRRFLARKNLRSAHQERAVISIQAFIRFLFTRKTFVDKRKLALLNQKMYRGNTARRNYRLQLDKRKEEQMRNDAATTIQCMGRVRVARMVYAALEEMASQTSEPPPDTHLAVQKETMVAHRKAAVSRQAAMDRAREVDDLALNLANAENNVAKAERVVGELASIKALLAATEAELRSTKLEVASKVNRLAKLEEENSFLREKLQGLDFATGESYDRKIYAEFPDLEKLDRNMFAMVSRSEKSKGDVKALVSALAVLR